MLEKLLSYIEGPEEPYDPSVRLDSIHLEDEDGVLCVSVRDHFGTEEWSRWEVRARVLRDYRIVDPFGELTVCDGDHVLVRQHTESRQELFFRGVPQSPLETMGRLVVSHREVAGGWIPFERFITCCCNLEDLLRGGFGILADGPTFLIETYANALSSEGLKSNALPPRPAKWWNGRQWLENTVPLVALVIGDSFFVAEGFDEQQLSGSKSR